MYKLKTIILSGLIGVSIISNCFAGEEENLENYGEIRKQHFLNYPALGFI